VQAHPMFDEAILTLSERRKLVRRALLRRAADNHCVPLIRMTSPIPYIISQLGERNRTVCTPGKRCVHSLRDALGNAQLAQTRGREKQVRVLGPSVSCRRCVWRAFTQPGSEGTGT